MPSPRDPARQSLVRRLTPWVIGLAILGWMIHLIPRAELARAIEGVSVGRVIAAIVVGNSVGLLLDAYSIGAVLRPALPTVKIPFWDVVRIRGTTYLLGIVNYGAGQGGIAYYLVRRYGVPTAEAVGAVMLVAGVSLAVVALAAAAGVGLGGTPAHPALRLCVLGMASIFPAYLAVLALRPTAARKLAILRPVIDVGLRGNLLGVLARVPQLLLMLAMHALVMREFGVEPTVTAVLTLLPLVFFVGVVPVSPFGLGTAQATAVVLFAPFGTAATDDARQAAVLAYSLTTQMVALVVQALLGLGCWLWLRRTTTRTAPSGAPPKTLSD